MRQGKITLIEFSKFIENTFLKADIIGLGETSHGRHLKVFRHLKMLNRKVKNNLSGIFLELPNNFQVSVNYYLKTKKYDKSLKGLIRGAAKEGKNFKKMFNYIFEFAGDLNIPVICTDSSKIATKEYNKRYSHNLTWYLKGKSRDEDMASIIKANYFKKKGKWFFIAHLGHTGYKIAYEKNIPAGSLLKKEFNKKYFCIGLVNKRKSKSDIKTLKYTSDMANVFLET